MTESEEHVIFYYEIALAITQWASIEMALYRLVECCVNLNQSKMLSYGFFGIENFRSKLQFASQIISERFSSHPEIGRWKPLQKRITNASSKRNSLVHRGVMIFPMSKEGRRYALVEWPKYEEDKTKIKSTKNIPPRGSLCALDIMQFRYEFFALNLDMYNLIALFEGQPEPYPESQRQQVRQPKSHELVDQIHAILGHRP